MSTISAGVAPSCLASGEPSVTSGLVSVMPQACSRKTPSRSRNFSIVARGASMVYRVRKQLAEEGFEAVLSRKQRATPAVARIFDGEKEAKLIALACSK